MINEWQLQTAKNKFSEVINLAISQGPQLITRHGEKTAVLISYAEYERLCKVNNSLSHFFRDSPLADAQMRRDDDTPRTGFTL